MWQDRLCKILDEKSINKLKNSTVLIIGLGGVGGSALESVVRMGIGNIVVVDNDIVDITNLNRQLLSLRSNIGISKVEVARERILDINPDCNVTIVNKFIDASNYKELFKLFIIKLPTYNINIKASILLWTLFVTSFQESTAQFSLCGDYFLLYKAE
jgi:tRNA A37 threonylcarbamoyladenosine dehydratase